MQLSCEKYKKKVDAEGASCEHLTEYCKFRDSCIINFLGKEATRTKPVNTGLRGKDDSGKS